MRTRNIFVLASHAGGPRLSQQDLSRLLNLDPATVAPVLDEMQQPARRTPPPPGRPAALRPRPRAEAAIS
ncbi:hypothetical protein [Actinoplanes sp. TFC3]|uniref:hypothetical protein n=1 Tax=Actinoplanes sp. TFC3 TaxID=1710355 RepID=UPI000B1D192E|nr:hypothetical protein [Actinoplanes sp. TFC3]